MANQKVMVFKQMRGAITNHELELSPDSQINKFIERNPNYEARSISVSQNGAIVVLFDIHENN